jgi:hypothetical protein
MWIIQYICYCFIVNSSYNNARGKYLIFNVTAYRFKFMDGGLLVRFLVLSVRTFCRVSHRIIRQTT